VVGVFGLGLGGEVRMLYSDFVGGFLYLCMIVDFFEFFSPEFFDFIRVLEDLIGIDKIFEFGLGVFDFLGFGGLLFSDGVDGVATDTMGGLMAFFYIDLALFFFQVVLDVDIRYSRVLGDGLAFDDIEFLDAVDFLSVFVVLVQQNVDYHCRQVTVLFRHLKVNVVGDFLHLVKKVEYLHD
jgi:hypothetical protein